MRRIREMFLFAVFAPGAASAAESYALTDFTSSGWGVFFLEVVRSFDLVGFVLITLLLVVLGMSLDLFSHLRVRKLIPEDLLADVQEEMANGEYEKALEMCEKSDSLIGEVFSAALMKTDYSFERMQEAMRGELAIQGVVWRQWVRQFRVAAWCGLLAGLLGAVVGGMRFVADLNGRPNVALAASSSFEVRGLLYNVLTALALGVLISLAALMAYVAASSKLEKILLESGRLGEELLDPFRPLPLPPEE